MAGDTNVTIIGNLTDAPELRFTPAGVAVANFAIASTPRSLNRNTNEWEDGETLFLRCSVWRDAAENVAESLNKGSRVIVSGRLRARSYETAEGETRNVFEIDVDEVGPSLRFATATVKKMQRLSTTNDDNDNGNGAPVKNATRAPAQKTSSNRRLANTRS